MMITKLQAKIIETFFNDSFSDPKDIRIGIGIVLDVLNVKYSLHDEKITILFEDDAE